MYFTPSFIQPWAVFFLWYLGCSDSLTYTQLIDIHLKKPTECSFPLLIQHDRCQSSEKRLCFRKCLNYTALLLHASKFFFNKKKCLRSKGAWWFLAANIVYDRKRAWFDGLMVANMGIHQTFLIHWAAAA